ncbi:hypothetical protein BS50DRAFT_539097 [Corynespora cassiicola Philippines]|uniref:Uncharacterized protein n=1 Tax=Corynespora cassiicola Philippines TaxID=1448308 RepID=A0A2T2P913_CORCC|nr:hypothetical protein BS50DRAFT_539097 [Corynespora cassiicola Philippines]
MEFLERREAPVAQMSTTAFAAIVTGVGVTMLGLIVIFVLKLISATRTHKRLLADLEERGFIIQQARTHANASISKPQAVLRRNTALPFNAKSGWDALLSNDTISCFTEAGTIPPHYAPSKPDGVEDRPSRLSWPFSTRRTSRKAIRMRKIRVPILSTVIESPKPSPLVPVLNNPPGRDSSSLHKSISRRSSDQSLLQRHPAYRHLMDEQLDTEKNRPCIQRSLTTQSTAKSEVRVRPNRSRSVAEIPLSTKPGMMSRFSRPQLHARSASMCSQSSGKAPDIAIPPLPLEVVRIQNEARRKSLLSRNASISSAESGHSSILAMQNSPMIPHTSSVQVQRVAKRNWRNSMVTASRPARDTLALHDRNHSQSSIKSNSARFISITPSNLSQSKAGNGEISLTSLSNAQFATKAIPTDHTSLEKADSFSYSPLTHRSLTTPRRRTNPYVTPFGSPEERRKSSSILETRLRSYGVPKRQHSQTSTNASSVRSSNGNPFQWDPTPLSLGKPSVLKGSPSARKGHRRQNCVRISLEPTILGPPSRPVSSYSMKDIQEESLKASSEHSNFIIENSSARALPSPPSTAVFNPELKLTRTTIRASLTPSSPTLSMANYDHVSIDSSLMHNSSKPSNEYPNGIQPPATPLLPSSPFDSPSPDLSSSPGRLISSDEYNPGLARLIFQAPTNTPTHRNPSQFPTIPEESSISSHKTKNFEKSHSEDSPPCSPKTVPSRLSDDTVIPERSLDIVDPTVLSKGSFAMLNVGFNNDNSTSKTPFDSRFHVPLPSSPESARSIFEPLLNAAFPSNALPNAKSNSFSNRSSPSSLYSLASPPPSRPTSLIPHCSPRPAHAKLPTPNMNTTEIPRLNPFLIGPRDSPSRPLRTSIQKLRRMNSDAEKGGREERRYLRLDRESSISVPGDESWLEELDATDREEEDAEWERTHGLGIVSEALDDWEEGAAVLDLEDAVGDGGAQAQLATENTGPLAPQRTSTIWEDEEKVLEASPPQVLPYRLCTPEALVTVEQPKSSSRKRQFEVARDDSPSQEDLHSKHPDKIAVNTAETTTTERRIIVGARYRKKSVLGVSTPNVKIQVQPPSAQGTPASLYDADGFLR